MHRVSKAVACAASGAALGAAAVLAGPSCATILGMEEPEPLAPGGGGGAASGGSGHGGHGGGAGGHAECAHATYPLPPDSGTGGGELDIVMAIRAIYVEDEDGDPVGFDLENVCTCQGQGPTCDAPSADLECDAPRGVDNNLRHLFTPLQIVLGEADLPAYYSQQAEVGEWSLLMRIRDYNGEADDRQVRVSWYVTQGSLAVPAWTGADSWEVSASSLNAGADGGLDLDSPRLDDDSAFVHDYTVVASLPVAELPLGGGSSGIVLPLTAGGASADLRSTGGLWFADNGRFFGRVRLSDVFSAISTFRDSSGNAICTDHGIYQQLKTGICQLPDILTASGSAADPCDAVSAGLGFAAEQALLGNATADMDAGAGCPDGTSPADDTCAPW